MPATKKNIDDSSTEEKIKNAARVVFHKKGFSATRTRDIAEEANINHALLNYYFRSKKKLFDIIMMETMDTFLQSLTQVFNNKETLLSEKVNTIVSSYIDLLIAKPEIPIFVLSELRSHPKDFALKLNAREKIMKSIFMQQLTTHLKKNKLQHHPLHYIINIMGLTVFPFIAAPIIQNMGDLKPTAYTQLMNERKALVPLWINQLLKIQ